MCILIGGRDWFLLHKFITGWLKTDTLAVVYLHSSDSFVGPFVNYLYSYARSISQQLYSTFLSFFFFCSCTYILCYVSNTIVILLERRSKFHLHSCSFLFLEVPLLLCHEEVPFSFFLKFLCSFRSIRRTNDHMEQLSSMRQTTHMFLSHTASFQACDVTFYT